MFVPFSLLGNILDTGFGFNGPLYATRSKRNELGFF